MKVNRITPMLYSNHKVPLNNKRKNNNKTTNNSYNPIAYRDYNVNFGARLFRTPENFYEQPFNKNGMPDAMKNYLYADYEDRKAWAKMMLTNISKAGFFSSDRTIQQYNKDIWKLD